MFIPYPSNLLPNAQKFHSFSYSPECFLCRRSIAPEKMYDDNGDIEVAALQIEDFFDYSVNLVNKPGYTANCIATNAEDVLIEVQEKHFTRQDYTGDDSAVPKVTDLHATKSSNGYFMVRIVDIESIKTTFPFDKNQKKNSPKTFKLDVKVSHKPNLINITHFEFECWSDINNSYARIKTGNMNEGTYRQIIIHIIRDEMINLVPNRKSA